MGKACPEHLDGLDAGKALRISIFASKVSFGRRPSVSEH
jgi:hypothetical protein